MDDLKELDQNAMIARIRELRNKLKSTGTLSDEELQETMRLSRNVRVSRAGSVKKSKKAEAAQPFDLASDF